MVLSMLQEDGTHRVATDLRNMKDEESVMEPLFVDFPR